jgi:hypothetical protein
MPSKLTNRVLRFWLIGTLAVFAFVFAVCIALGQDVGQAALGALMTALPVGAVATYGRARRR